MEQVLAPVGGGSNNGEVITLADGGYMAVWTHLVTPLFPIPNVTDVQATAVLGRIFNADGTPRGAVFQVNQSDAASGQGQPDLALLSNGTVAVVWTDGPNLTDFDVAARGRVIAADGTPISDEFELSSVTDRDQRIPQVTANDSGGFFATWSDGRSPWSNTREQWIGQEFDATGNRVGPEIWIRDDSAGEDSELLYFGGDTFHLVASQGRTFLTDDLFTYSGNIKASTNFTNSGGSTPSFGFESDAASNGQGNTAIARSAGPFAVTVNLGALVEVPNGQTGNFSDGTPFAETFTFLTSDPQAVASNGLVTLGFSGFNVRPDGVTFTPQTNHYPAVATTFLQNGNIAVVWTAVSGGTSTVPEFSVYAQILSPEGLILSDLTVIADQDVVGTELAPPFVSAGADGKLFIGWTGTTDRNGAGTNEVKGGVFDIPTYDYDSLTPSGAFATNGDDVITGTPFQPEDSGQWLLYLFDGDDVFFEGDGVGQVYGMDGDDLFIRSPDAQFGNEFFAGLGRDTIDHRLLTAGIDLPRQDVTSNGNRAREAEVVIGTLHDDTAEVTGGSETLDRLLHTEAGNDTIRFFSGSGMTVDGGEGTDELVTFDVRANWLLQFHGDHYTLDYLNNGEILLPDRTLTVRAVERVVFADQTVTLQPTASLVLGPVDPGDILPPGINGTSGDDVLVGTGIADPIYGYGGDDYLFGDGARATYYGATLANQVYRLYQATLDRAPDLTGHANWTGRLATGERTLLEVADGFVRSPQFKAIYSDSLTNEQFVTLLYNNVLDRAPDAQGLARWTGELAGGASRAEVVLGFSQSPQFVTNTNAAATAFAKAGAPSAWSDEVYRLYQATLDRAPDLTGQTNWTDRLAVGSHTLLDVADGFVRSPQFKAIYDSLDNTQFVTVLYNNVLNRAPDAQGLARWTGELAAGASRAEVVLGFSQSPQFIASSEAGLKAWMRAQGEHDRLDPGSGTNVVAGGQFADTFIFHADQDGSTRVLDLEAWDRIEFDGFGYAAVAEARAEMTQVNANVVFADQGVEVIFEGVTLAQITDDMILV